MSCCILVKYVCSHFSIIKKRSACKIMFENDGETGHFLNNTFDPTLCFLCLSLSLQRNSSISGSTRGMYQVSERRSSPSTGWVSNTLLYIRHIVRPPTMSYPFIVPLYHEELYATNVDVHWNQDAKAGCWGRQYCQKASLRCLTPRMLQYVTAGGKNFKKQQCALSLNAFSLTYWLLGFWW